MTGLGEFGQWSFDRRTLEIETSAGIWHIAGLPPRPSARADELLGFIHPDDRDEIAAVLGEVRESPERAPATGRFRIVRSDGAVRDVRWSAWVEDDRWVGVHHDITDVLGTARELAVRRAVGRALGQASGIPALLEALCHALSMKVGALFVPGDDAGLVARDIVVAPDLEHGHAIREAVARHTARHGKGRVGTVWVTGRPVVATRLADQANATAARLTELGICAGVGIPVLRGEEATAVLAFLAPRLPKQLVGIEPVLMDAGRLLGRCLTLGGCPLAVRLTARELEVLRLAADGVPGPEIADRLGVGPATVKTHFAHLYAKLGVPDRAAAVAYALRQGLID